MAYCSKCGTQLSDEAKFCPKCGKNINEVSFEQSEEQESPKTPDVSESNTSKKILPIIVGVFVLAILGGGWWSYKSSKEKVANTDSLLMANLGEVEDVEEIDTELIKDAFNGILDKCSSSEWGDLGTYFLYDITGDNIPELWVYADDSTDFSFHIYTFKDKQAISIYKSSFDPGRTGFGYSKGKIYVKTGGMGHEEWNLFKYENGKIVTEEVYSLSQNPPNFEDEVSGVDPKCEDIKTYKIIDKTPLDKIRNGSTLIKVKTDNGYTDNSDGSSNSNNGMSESNKQKTLEYMSELQQIANEIDNIYNTYVGMVSSGNLDPMAHGNLEIKATQNISKLRSQAESIWDKLIALARETGGDVRALQEEKKKYLGDPYRMQMSLHSVGMNTDY